MEQIKGAKYDEGKPRPSLAKDIHVDWVWTGPGPDPRGEEGELGPGVTKEVQQCGDASGRGND